MIRYCALCGVTISLDERIFKVHYENGYESRYMCFCHRHDKTEIDNYVDNNISNSPYIMYGNSEIFYK